MEDRDPASTALRRELRSRLGRLGAPLQIVAEDVLGEDDARIDWVAVEPGGRVCVALLELDTGSEALLARGLAQRAWVQARLRDWRQLAPGLAARLDRRPRLLLLAPEFGRVARIAAREADPESLQLARFRWIAGEGGSAELRVELLEPPAGASAEPPREEVPLASVFRSGLSEKDFGGNGGERGEPRSEESPRGDIFRPRGDNS